jgi:hypothetical protein
LFFGRIRANERDFSVEQGDDFDLRGGELERGWLRAKTCTAEGRRYV